MQVRQRVGHKRTFLYLEQIILKKQGSKGALSIEVFKDGMDFYFGERGTGERTWREWGWETESGEKVRGVEEFRRRGGEVGGEV